MAEGNRVRGTKQLATAIDANLFDEWKAWVQARGETIREALELAMRRHMAHPPAPVPLDPLPTVETDERAQGKAK
jgi:hypothetical protein